LKKYLNVNPEIEDGQRSEWDDIHHDEIHPSDVNTESGFSKMSLADRVTRDRCYDFKNIIAEKFSEKLAFLFKNKGKLCKLLIISLVFEKNAIFFAENWRKSQKIVIITSTPDWPIVYFGKVF
jgi:hypothetical protein